MHTAKTRYENQKLKKSRKTKWLLKAVITRPNQEFKTQLISARFHIKLHET